MFSKVFAGKVMVFFSIKVLELCATVIVIIFHSHVFMLHFFVIVTDEPQVMLNYFHGVFMV